MAKKRKLTIRERALIKAIPKHKTMKAAALAAGYSPNNPDQSAYQALNAIKLKMPELMDKMGLTDEALIEKHLVPLLNATETKFSQFEGKFTDEREVIAWGPRTSGLDMAWKLKGRYAKSDEDGAKVGVSVIILNSPRPQRPAIDVPTNGNGHTPPEE
jgi:hypothetical protein